MAGRSHDLVHTTLFTPPLRHSGSFTPSAFTPPPRVSAREGWCPIACGRPRRVPCPRAYGVCLCMCMCMAHGHAGMCMCTEAIPSSVYGACFRGAAGAGRAPIEGGHVHVHMYMHMSKERTSGELLVQVGRRLRVDGVVLAPLPHVHLRPAARATRGHGAFSVRRAACGTRMHATPCEQPLHTSSSESYAGMATRSCHHAPGSP